MKKLVCWHCGYESNKSVDITSCPICGETNLSIADVVKSPEIPTKSTDLLQLHQGAQRELAQLSERFERVLELTPFGKKVEKGLVGVEEFSEFVWTMRDAYDIKYPPFDKKKLDWGMAFRQSQFSIANLANRFKKLLFFRHLLT